MLNFRLAVLTFETTDEESWAIEILNNTLEFTYDQGRELNSTLLLQGDP